MHLCCSHMTKTGFVMTWLSYNSIYQTHFFFFFFFNSAHVFYILQSDVYIQDKTSNWPFFFFLLLLNDLVMLHKQLKYRQLRSYFYRFKTYRIFYIDGNAKVVID